MCSTTTKSLGTSLVHASLQTEVRSQMPAQALGSVLSSMEGGALGDLSLGGREKDGTLDGLKLLALSFLSALSSLLYIIFIKFFLLIIPMFRFCSRRYFTLYWLFFHMLHFPHLYLFPVSSVFLLFLTFTCAPVYPSTCFHLSFHVLWLCSQPFPSYYDTLYFYDLPSLRSRLILTQYINQCIFSVVLQFVNWRWFPPLISSL